MAMSQEDKFALAYKEFKGKIRTFARGSYRQLPGSDIEDLEQELLIVLHTCVEHYNPDKGATFNTFFQRSAQNKIITLVRKTNTQSRCGDNQSVSLDEEAVALAIGEALADESAETLALRNMHVSELVAKNPELVKASGRGRRKKIVA